jgi:hypothetical protein
VFPEQVSAPRNRTAIANLTEGLEPWQPKKIYYFSDAVSTDFLKGQGPEYSTTDVSPSKHEPYYKLAADEMVYHLTQDDTGQMAKKALESGDFAYFKEPVRLALGKSLVPCSTTGDIFDGIAPGAIPYAPVRGYRPETRSGLSVDLGGPWAFYRDFWQAHNLDTLSGLIKTPEVALANASQLHVPIFIRNDTDRPAEITLTSSLPPGWREISGTTRYPVRAHEAYPAQSFYVAPSTGKPEWQTLSWKAEANGQMIGTITLRVLTDSPGLPQ